MHLRMARAYNNDEISGECILLPKAYNPIGEVPRWIPLCRRGVDHIAVCVEVVRVSKNLKKLVL